MGRQEKTSAIEVLTVNNNKVAVKSNSVTVH
jgi:hypothetical protein